MTTRRERTNPDDLIGAYDLIQLLREHNRRFDAIPTAAQQEFRRNRAYVYALRLALDTLGVRLVLRSFAIGQGAERAAFDHAYERAGLVTWHGERWFVVERSTNDDRIVFGLALCENDMQEGRDGR